MRIRLRRHRPRGPSELVITPGRRETLEVRRAEWLRTLRQENHLAFSYDCRQDGSHVVLRYDVDGMTTLRARLARPLAADELARLLAGLARALERCADDHMPPSALLFDPRHAYVDAAGELRLAYVPLSVPDSSRAGSPLSLLAVLGDVRRLRLATPADAALPKRVSAFVLAAQGVFSLNDYRSLVARLCARAAPAGVGPSSSDAIPTRLAGSPPGAWRLRRMSTGETYELVADLRLRLGRGSACELRVLGNPQVSRHHANVLWQGGAVVLEDAGSTNGTFAGGRALTAPARLAEGARFSVADEEFLVMGP